MCNKIRHKRVFNRERESMKQAAYNYGTGWKVSQNFFSSKEEAEESLKLKEFLNYQLIWPARFRLVPVNREDARLQNPEYELELVVPDGV